MSSLVFLVYVMPMLTVSRFSVPPFLGSRCLHPPLPTVRTRGLGDVETRAGARGADRIDAAGRGQVGETVLGRAVRPLPCRGCTCLWRSLRPPCMNTHRTKTQGPGAPSRSPPISMLIIIMYRYDIYVAIARTERLCCMYLPAFQTSGRVGANGLPPFHNLQSHVRLLLLYVRTPEC